ncbi:ABC transporter permease [Paraferrimonas sp. SM1919]|uniref:ABC transporter permease n=1 Tax=Paraferrimonas sp. SM1919 TaxID=2662263 RepID=UPI0013D06586|nr:ABC transporter permease [Paraferrimonas sp. SM1919]
MLVYLLKRLNLLIATTLALFLVLFITTKSLPTSPQEALTGKLNPSAEHLQQVQLDYGLEKSNLEQFYFYIKQRLSGDFGLSITTQIEISSELQQVLPASLELGFYSLFLATLLGIPIGVFAAMIHSKFWQDAILSATITAYSVPVFWLGISLSLWFGIELDWFPVSERQNLLYQIEPVTGFLVIDCILSDSELKWFALNDALRHLVLPTLTLALLPLAIITRATFNAMIEVMSQNYIRAAKARGLNSLQVVIKHALPNALLPVLRQFGNSLGMIASYAIITEVIFSWPGIGSWLLAAINQRDYTAIQGGVLIVSLFIIVSTILIDIIHTWFNPLSRKELYGKG